MIEAGTILTTKELYEYLHITKRTWTTNKEQILEQIGKVCQYEVIYEGRSILYHFFTNCDYTYKRKIRNGDVVLLRD